MPKFAGTTVADSRITSDGRDVHCKFDFQLSVAAKACVAEALVAILNYDRDVAVELFVTLCEDEEALLGTRYVERFLYYATSTHFESLKPILEKMLQLQLATILR